MLHGRGADESDLYDLLDLLDPDGRLLGLTPRGPITDQFGGAHWYVSREVGFPDPDTFERTLKQTSDWLAEISVQTGIPPSGFVIGGFSQGAVMSYSLCLGRDQPRRAGLIALSGFIPTVAGFAVDLDASHDIPVAIAHGTLDPVIPCDFSREARRLLEGAGLTVMYQESEMGHSIDPAMLTALVPWLSRLPAGGPSDGTSPERILPSPTPPSSEADPPIPH